ncbi:hypothetical protein [Pararobbsia alpina]|uniref:Uncharacterized protein n=1 Tax=Pararobbsia alpina TaxID=621374 RepID=A0A6S7AYC7_9BURK|nr:hypothetical protein [Pararobbsia alpina]CAB3779450.1 hypothetical protein LMG28138_00818 [Pararobbsia alpina]
MIRLKRDVITIGSLFLFFLGLVLAAGIFFELLFWPLLAWQLGSTDYELPTIDRLRKWGKFILIISPVCLVIMLLYEKKAFGR